MDSMVGEPSTSQHDGNPSGPIATVEKAYKGWMNKFCLEPTDDARTCCLGFWLPCVLYGKIDERLELIQSGKDPRMVGNGCNGSCIVWVASAGGLCGILTANRRSRVRGTYGIQGTLTHDNLVGIFCNRCILMQMDREMRARDGQMELRTCPVYRNTKVIDLQPLPNQGMRYMSAEEFSSSNPAAYPVASRRSPQARPPTGIKIQNKISNRKHPLQEVFNAPGSDHAVKIGVQRAKNPALSKQNKLQKETQSSQPATKEKGLKSFFSNTMPDLSRYFKQDLSSRETAESSPGTAKPFIPAEAHALVDCTVVAAPAKADSKTAVNSHVLSECAGVDRDITAPGTMAVSEHSLTDCETIVLTGRRSSNASVHQMSYVHDFTDCPVDRDVLEFLEEEEKRSHGHELEDCPILAPAPRGNSASGPALEGGESSALPDCCLNDTSSTDSVKQHRLSGCKTPCLIPPQPVEDIAQQNVPETSRTNSANMAASTVPDCCLEDSSNSESVQQHNLKDCKRLSSFAPALKVAVDDPELPQSSQADDQAVQQADLPDCCDEDYDVVAAIQHRLSEYSRSSSMSALIMQKSEQHRLSQCIRSSSLPIIESRNSSQHELEDCSPTDSMDSLPSKNLSSTNTHNLEDCHCGESSESSHQGEVIVEEPQKYRKGQQSVMKSSHSTAKASKKADKGKKRAGGGQSNVTSKAADSKKRDVVVAVDVMVGGSKFKATMIGTTDGGNSPRPSEIRERSAQQALENVLTASQKQISHKGAETKGSRKHPYQRYPRAKTNRQNNNSQTEHATSASRVQTAIPKDEKF